ncbi:hypothetical protein SAY87_018886 [Trapa incisa]|uniref:SAM domain-containing protein n=1 Tax=Trapa incisa TaxID=236973 RepID=A0AAN7K5Q2_9MYRT|nr:hypothetical protein SAY87_018886 [Trapa incisa]
MDWFAWLSKTALDPALVYEYGLKFTRNELVAEDIPHFNHEFLQSMGISIAKHRLEILKVAWKDTAASRPGGPLSLLTTAINRTKRSFGNFIRRLLVSDDGVAEKESRKHIKGYNMEEGLKEDEEKVVVPYIHGRLSFSGPLDGDLEQHKYLTEARRSPRPKPKSGPLMVPRMSGPTLARHVFVSRNPKFSGPLDGPAVKRSPILSGAVNCQLGPSKSMKSSSGPPDRATGRSPRVSRGVDRAGPGRRSSPRVYGGFEKEGSDAVDGFDEHSLWAKLFDDLKPT